MPNSLPIAPGIILEGLGEWLGATCLAPGLIHIFLAFAASWPVQGGSRSFLEVEFEKCDLPCARRVARFSERQVSVLFSDDLAEI